MFIKSCIAHLYHFPGFDQVGYSPGEPVGVAILGVSGGVGGVRGVLGASSDFRYSGTRRGIGASGELGAPRGHLGVSGGIRGVGGVKGCIGC